MHVSQLYVYPIKSLRATPITEGVLSPLGLKYDRRFMLLKVEPREDGTGTDLKNMHVPHFPEMALFETSLEMPDEENSGKVRVTYHPASMNSEAEAEAEASAQKTRPRETRHLEIPLEPNVESLSRFAVTMHQSPTSGYNMGPEYNDWFSECFGYPVVLAYLGVNTREVLGTLAPARSKIMKKGHRWGLQSLLQELSGPGPSVLERWLVPICVLAVCVSGVSYAAGHVDPGTTFTSITTSFSSLYPASMVILVGALALIVGGVYVGGKGSFLSAKHEDRITFADCAPFLVISETSVNNVSERLPAGESMDRTKFRPNIVVSGAESAFEEDFWTELVIGPNRIRLLLTGNCVRCQSLNVDYSTGKMGAGESGTVLKKLMKDRRVDRGAKFSPVFGRYSFLDRGFSDGAEVRVGDVVEVVARSTERSVLDWPGLTN